MPKKRKELKIETLERMVQPGQKKFLLIFAKTQLKNGTQVSII